VLFDEEGADETDDGVSVGEDPDDVGSPPDLFVESLEGVVGPDLEPVGLRKEPQSEDLVSGLVEESSGVGQRAGRALASDAAGTSIGAFLGTSTVSSYIESTAGIAMDGRTGLTNIVTGLLFLVALPLAPLVKMIGAASRLPRASSSALSPRQR